MATLTNQSKNTANLTNSEHEGRVFWADAQTTWGSADASWGVGGSQLNSQARNTTTLTNQSKN